MSVNSRAFKNGDWARVFHFCQGLTSRSWLSGHIRTGIIGGYIRWLRKARVT
jgi:hypothetical protein